MFHLCVFLYVQRNSSKRWWVLFESESQWWIFSTGDWSTHSGENIATNDERSQCSRKLHITQPQSDVCNSPLRPGLWWTVDSRTYRPRQHICPKRIQADRRLIAAGRIAWPSVRSRTCANFSQWRWNSPDHDVFQKAAHWVWRVEIELEFLSCIQ